jgi:hypothetical protein
MRTALLAAVSHDLRTPLASAKAAVNGLRSPGIHLTGKDHDELLATADESLDLLAHLVASLLDVSRLQAGALPMFLRPAELHEIIARSLDGIGPLAGAVVITVPPELPPVMVDPPIMERVIANVTANALRYSPGGSPPLLTASSRGNRVELRVADRGPGVPVADRNRMFLPFQRLGDTGNTVGVGLGLTVSRGLTEAMHGTLEPEETPGGGLTMAISVPAAPGLARPGSGRLLRDRRQGLPGPAGLGTYHDQRDPVDQVEHPEQQRESDRADVGPGEEHDAERDGDQPGHDEQCASSRGLAPAEGSEDLQETAGERPERHDQHEHQRGGPGPRHGNHRGGQVNQPQQQVAEDRSRGFTAERP